MPRPLVEHAGAPWHAGSLLRRSLFIGTRKGRVQVGNRVLAWELVSKPFGVLTSENDGSGERGRVILDTTRLPNGGWRWWFVCPGCAKRCDLLYAAAGSGKLTCRRCGGFAYASQRTRPAGAPRPRRNRSTLTVTREVKHSIKWGIACKDTTITLWDNSIPGEQGG
jgi:hypothetical protein